MFSMDCWIHLFGKILKFCVACWLFVLFTCMPVNYGYVNVQWNMSNPTSLQSVSSCNLTFIFISIYNVYYALCNLKPCLFCNKIVVLVSFVLNTNFHHHIHIIKLISSLEWECRLSVFFTLFLVYIILQVLGFFIT